MEKDKANNRAYKNRTELKQTLYNLNKYETHPRVILPFTSHCLLSISKRETMKKLFYTLIRDNQRL